MPREFVEYDFYKEDLRAIAEVIDLAQKMNDALVKAELFVADIDILHVDYEKPIGFITTNDNGALVFKKVVTDE